MKSRATIRGTVLLLLGTAALASALSGHYDWRWNLPGCQPAQTSGDVKLTDRNGSRAADMWYEFGDYWYARVILEDSYDHSVWVLPYENGVADDPVAPDPDSPGERPCMLISTNKSYLAALWYKQSGTAWFASAGWPGLNEEDWDVREAVTTGGENNGAFALGEGVNLGDAVFTYACYRDEPPEESDGVWFRMATGRGGGSWGTPVQISTDPADQIALSTGDPQCPFVAYHYWDASAQKHKVKLWKSNYYGTLGSWSEVFDDPLEDAAQPSIAVDGWKAAVCWVKRTNGDPTLGGKVWVCWSDNFYTIDHSEPAEVAPYNQDPAFLYNAPTMSVVPTGSTPYSANLIIVSELSRPINQDPREHWLSATCGLFGNSNTGIAWRRPEHYVSVRANEADENANPCVDACIPYGGRPLAYCFYTADGAAHRALWRIDAEFVPVSLPPPADPDGVGRRIRLDPDGAVSYAARAGANVHSGPALEDNFLLPILADGGASPALAVDAEGERWVTYIRDDTVWCLMAEGGVEPLFAGSSSARPGQPSIECYPTAGDNGYACGVVFPVYDSSGGGSMVLFARSDSASVVLDTLATRGDFGDSMSCLSIAGDTCWVTYQAGESVMSRFLADYGPNTSGRPPAWSSASVVTASGRAPMNRLEGDILHTAFTRKIEVTGVSDTFVAGHATCDVDGGQFNGWQEAADFSSRTTSTKVNAGYASCGVGIWQELMGNGKWGIRATVRGDSVTLVASDTDAYHPHAVACSSQVSPSVSQVRVNLLWTQGVVFEVDSAVYDTGEARFKADSFNVSNAGANATAANNGAKLARKPGSDSLVCVYSDASGGTYYARSADGSDWTRAVLAADCESPAIGHDGAGKRWAVMEYDGGSHTKGIEARCLQSSGSWSSPQTLYPANSGSLGPASLAGASSETDSCGYGAFLYDDGSRKFLIAAKFNGSVVKLDTVADGTALGDPCIAVQPSPGEGGDYLHLVWSDNGEVKYTMTDNVIEAGNWSGGFPSAWKSVVNLSNTQNPSVRPVIAADEERVVVAWAERSTPDVLARSRTTQESYDQWDDTINLSNTADYASDRPTIGLGDTCLVAWEESRSQSDHDLLVSIEFGDTINLGDNATVSAYPHVLFQNQASGDTAIPYVKAVWSETPQQDYYEVGFTSLNLKQASGGGQQSAGTIELLQPRLYSCAPNPFNRTTTISYQFGLAGDVTLRIYDINGRTIRTLTDSRQAPGRYSVTWDGRDDRNRTVARGVYFYRLDAPGINATKKAVVVR